MISRFTLYLAFRPEGSYGMALSVRPPLVYRTYLKFKLRFIS
jgi:hypothetical protein